MKLRDRTRAVKLNAEAVEWTRTHTVRDLEDLVNELSGFGEDVSVMARLLDELKEIDHSINVELEQVPPETRECAEMTG